jgi:hypothetical protein
MIDKATAICNEFSGFTDGVRVQMLIDRGIVNNNKGSRRWVNKLISYDQEGYYKNIVKLLEQQNYLADSNIRLYASVNSRKIESGIRVLHHAIIDLPGDAIVPYYCNIKDNFVSALMKPECRKSKYFLLDIDTQEENEIKFIDIYLSEITEIKLIKKYKSVKGWHYVTEPFDIRFIEGLKEWVDLKNDALLLLNYIGAEGE